MFYDILIISFLRLVGCLLRRRFIRSLGFIVGLILVPVVVVPALLLFLPTVFPGFPPIVVFVTFSSLLVVLSSFLDLFALVTFLPPIPVAFPKVWVAPQPRRVSRFMRWSSRISNSIISFSRCRNLDNSCA